MKGFALTSLLTLTSDRPVAFALCERWMAAQSFKSWDEWVVVDDGVEPANTTMGQTHIRLPNIAGGLSSFRRNLEVGLGHTANAGILCFIEDDVWYRNDYLSSMISGLDYADIAGSAHCRDYSVSRRMYRVCSNMNHASLCQTAIRKVASKILMSIVEENDKPYLDKILWDVMASERYTRMLFPDSQRSVNMKNMPGKAGLIGHGVMRGFYDDDCSVLSEWLGSDYKFYERFYQCREKT
jgi:hypothetical protein